MNKRKPERRNWKLFFPVFEIKYLKNTNDSYMRQIFFYSIIKLAKLVI